MSVEKCNRDGCRWPRSSGRDDGLCWRCRKADTKRNKRLNALVLPRSKINDGGTCERCQQYTPHALRDGKCGNCRTIEYNQERARRIREAGPQQVCSVMKCRYLAELGGRTCLEHRPVFERIVLAKRPSAEDFAVRTESVFDRGTGEG